MAFPAQTAAQRHHRKRVSETMRGMVTACPHCERRGNFRRHWLADAECLIWVCHYCRGEWTAADRSPPAKAPA